MMSYIKSQKRILWYDIIIIIVLKKNVYDQWEEF